MGTHNQASGGEHLAVATLGPAPFGEQAPRQEGSSQHTGREQHPRGDLECVPPPPHPPRGLAPDCLGWGCLGTVLNLSLCKPRYLRRASVFLLPVISQVGWPGLVRGPAQPEASSSHTIPYFGHCVGCRDHCGLAVAKKTLFRPRKPTQDLPRPQKST